METCQIQHALVNPLGLFYTHTWDSRGKSSLSALHFSQKLHCAIHLPLYQ